MSEGRGVATLLIEKFTDRVKQKRTHKKNEQLKSMKIYRRWSDRKIFYRTGQFLESIFFSILNFFYYYDFFPVLFG